MRTRTALLATPALCLALLTTACSNEPNPTEQGAAIMCEEFVKERLKSPGSADFSGVTDTTISTLRDKKPWRFKVTGHVDSDNALGASLRNEYVCTISTEDDDTWTLDNLELTEH